MCGLGLDFVVQLRFIFGWNNEICVATMHVAIVLSRSILQVTGSCTTNHAYACTHVDICSYRLCGQIKAFSRKSENNNYYDFY